MYLSKRRNDPAATRLFEAMLAGRERPRKVTTDLAAPLLCGVDELLPDALHAMRRPARELQTVPASHRHLPDSVPLGSPIAAYRVTRSMVSRAAAPVGGRLDGVDETSGPASERVGPERLYE